MCLCECTERHRTLWFKEKVMVYIFYLTVVERRKELKIIVQLLFGYIYKVNFGNGNLNSLVLILIFKILTVSQFYDLFRDHN